VTGFQRRHPRDICSLGGCELCGPTVYETLRANRSTDGESTSARLRRVEQERDQLSTAVAGWVARFHAAHEALYIEEFDGDSCPDLEATIEYALGAYRRVCASEAAAADRIELLRAELASARTELAQLRRSGWIVAHDGGRDCERCEQEIRRGDGYEEIPGTGGAYLHAYCPTEGEPDV
jgi:hypothetical protein